MSIADIIKDIFSDADNYSENHKEFLKDTGTYRSRDYKRRINRRRGGFGGFMVVLPQLVGFVIGLALAKIFSLGTVGYISLGALFAFVIGTYKSFEFDKMGLKHAVVKNILIMIFLFILIFFTILFIK